MCSITECIGDYTCGKTLPVNLFVLAAVLRAGAGLGEVSIVAADQVVGIAMAQLSGHRLLRFLRLSWLAWGRVFNNAFVFVGVWLCGRRACIGHKILKSWQSGCAKSAL
jgi:hypothetical protein